jgi:serine/threonine-protein phosphatase 2A regulatory subunit B
MYINRYSYNQGYFIDKTIKLWKVFERSIKVAHENDLQSNSITPRGLLIPKISHQDKIVAAIPRRIYANGTYHI